MAEVSDAIKVNDSIDKRADRLLDIRAEKLDEVTEKLEYSIMD